AGLPTILVAQLGHNPFPTGSVSMAFFGWTILALAIAGAKKSETLTFRALANLPILASALLAVLLIVRLGASPAYAYGSVKAQLFVAGNLLALVAAIAIASHERHFR